MCESHAIELNYIQDMGLFIKSFKININYNKSTRAKLKNVINRETNVLCPELTARVIVLVRSSIQS